MMMEELFGVVVAPNTANLMQVLLLDPTSFLTLIPYWLPSFSRNSPETVQNYGYY